jgi:hypothetical protein
MLLRDGDDTAVALRIDEVIGVAARKVGALNVYTGCRVLR